MPAPRTPLAVLLALASSAAADDTADADFFERRVRPVLVERCVGCHGPDKQKAGLRLDTRAALLKGGESGPAAEPGKPDRSRLVAAVRHRDGLEMPPGGRLPDRDADALEQWVRLGLPWPADARLAPPDAVGKAARTHWAFQPVKSPPLPAAGDGWARTPVDRFVAARLATAGLRPSPAADPRTLVRRVTFDLTGLPPTAEDVETFAKDPSPVAYAKLVDRLLASPRYGERQARHWLDVARYADTKGYVFFEDKDYFWAHTYRDYVIRAFNEDKPFDRFVVEQIAADRLAPADTAALAALGFLTVGGHFMGNTHDVTDDRIDVVTRGLMGLTVTCARCHDHKFDPVPTADYYSLYGVFRSSTEPVVPPLLGPPPDTDDYRTFAAELADRERKLVEFVTGRHRELVAGARARAGEYLAAAHAARHVPPTDEFMVIADRGDLNPAMTVRWRRYLDDARAANDTVWRHWHAYAAVPDAAFAVQSPAITTKLNADAGANRLVRAAFATPPKSMAEVADRYGKLLAAVEWSPAVAGAAAAGHAAAGKASAVGDADLRAVLYGPRSPADAPLALDWGFLSLFPDRATQGEYQKLLKAVEQQAAKGPPRPMALFDAARPFAPRVFERGNPGRPTAEVPRQFLKALNPDRKPFADGSGRLELAREIASPANPLTARVFVNRVWLHHFGRGLVGTPGDFGLRGDPPTHPELLDWLADDFVKHGWSVKHLHRRIVLSATYTQASAARPDAAAVDLENRLLARTNRRRLEFEALHDSMIAVAGALEPPAGGPPEPLLSGAKRAVYAKIDRLDFPGLLATFDVPHPAASAADRPTTTVPPQALFLLNGPFPRKWAARVVARPDVAQAKSPAGKVAALFRAALARTPTDRERELALAYIARGPEPDRWVDLAHGLLMSNEFAFVD